MWLLVAKLPSSQRNDSPAPGKINDQMNPSLGNEARKRDDSPAEVKLSFVRQNDQMNPSF